jgi:hypothetical protein
VTINRLSHGFYLICLFCAIPFSYPFSLLTSLTVILYQPPGIHFYLTSLILLMTTYCGIRFFKNQTIDSVQLGKLDVFFLVLSFTLPLILSLFHINDFSIWLDEYEEWSKLFEPDILSKAANYQQPSLSYYFRAIPVLFGGTSEFSIRLASSLFYAFTGPACYLLLREYTQKKIFSFAGSLFLLSNFWLLIYSVEARAYAISIFFFIQFVYHIYSHFYLRSVSKEDKSIYSKIDVSLLVATFLWLCSISFQPIVWISSIVGVAITYFVFNRQKKTVTFIAHFVAAFIIFYPILILIVQKSKQYLKNDSIQISELVFSLKEVSFSILNSLYFVNGFYVLLTGFMLLIIGLSLIFNKKKLVIVLLLSTWVGAIFISIFSFIVKVNWGFSPRYLLTAVPAFYLIFTACLFDLEMLKKLQTKILFILLSFSLFSLAQYPIIKPIGPKWRELYAYLDETSKTLQSSAFFFSLEKPGDWCDEFFLAKEFYPMKNVQTLGKRGYEFPSYMTNDMLVHHINEKIRENFFFVISSSSFDRSYLDKINWKYNSEISPKFIEIDRFWIFFYQSADLHQVSLNFYQELDRVMNSGENKIRVYDGLFMLYLNDHNCREAALNLKKYEMEFVKFGSKLSNYTKRLKTHKRKFTNTCKK